MFRLYTTLLILLLSISYTAAQEMNCEADSALLTTDFIVSPTPYVNDTLGEGIVEPACINTAYFQRFIVKAPSVFIAGGFPVTVSSFRIDSVTNLPDGLTYSCSTEDCVVLADSLACIFLSGTPTSVNEAGDYELVIALTVSVGSFGFPVLYPDSTLAPGTYVLTLNPEGDTACQATTPTLDIANQSIDLEMFPNPVFDRLNLNWLTKRSGQGQIELRNLTGALIQQIEVAYTDGINHYELPLSQLQSGMYIIGIHTGEGSTWRRIIKH